LFLDGVFFIYTRLEGTHEAIIDKDVFDLVQQQIQKRHRSTESCKQMSSP